MRKNLQVIPSAQDKLLNKIPGQAVTPNLGGGSCDH